MNVFPYYHSLLPYSYKCILLGSGAIALRPSPAQSLIEDTAAQKECAPIRDKARYPVGALPQNEYFARMRRG